MFPPHKSIRQFLSGASVSGGVAVWTALSTPFVVGGAALSVDAARIYNVDAELQAAADALAKAGAAELDQRGDSIARSSRAVQRLLSLDQKFADGNSAVEVDTITYYSAVPARDYQDMESSDRTNTPSQARYVEVKVKPKTVRTLFPPKLVRGLTNVTLSSKSVAGMDRVVCGAAPVFICNPVEGRTDTDIYKEMDKSEFRRTQVKFKTPNNVNDMFGRGNFGWLDPYGGNSGASVLADAIAIDIPDTCMSADDGVVMRTGNIASMRFGLNTRFDIYEGKFKRMSNDPRYAPAQNVIKGWANGGKGKGKGKNKKNASAGGCPTGASSDAMGLPRDDCFESGTCSDERWGTGQWDFAAYMALNHPGFSRITIEGVKYRIKKNGTFTPSAPPSRYAMYRWEIDNNCVPGRETYGDMAVTPEEGLPQCHSSGASTTVEDRRILTVAVLNCGAIQAGMDDGTYKKKDPVPVETFVKVFLTEPMGKGQQNIIYGEIVGPLDAAGPDGLNNDRVAVVR